MSRSIKKGPYVSYNLKKKINKINNLKKKINIKTWSRRSTITPSFINNILFVHNGNKFIKIFITENMVGHKLGEFAHTRNFKGHLKKSKIKKNKNKK